MNFSFRAILTLLYVVGMISCETKSNEEDIAKWKAEIMQTEKEFNDMAESEGVGKAFLAFAADNAVLMRSDRLVQGRSAIKSYFEKSAPNDYKLTWKPDYIDVSISGDLGYTYGIYVYSATDSLGNISKSEGIFHSVWKRQPDGKWKFVWD